MTDYGTAYDELASPEFQGKLRAIRQLLKEAYEHYFEHSDGHCKSSEGAMAIELPEYFWSFNADKRPTIVIYSYVLGPGRSHYFKDIDEALTAVRMWHAQEMLADYAGEWSWDGS
jgi:hypothetical protein